MKAYIAVSYDKRQHLAEAMDAVTATLRSLNITPFIFVDAYQFSPSQEKEMMQQAMTAIHQCDLLIAETTYKAIGIGIEAGYAVAKNKPVIYMRHKDAAHSTTLSGISTYSIIYGDPADLKEQLSAAVAAIIN
jgi:2'-deoxynucleoside 5'-phosphate N-hydrolase